MKTELYITTFLIALILILGFISTELVAIVLIILFLYSLHCAYYYEGRKNLLFAAVPTIIFSVVIVFNAILLFWLCSTVFFALKADKLREEKIPRNYFLIAVVILLILSGLDISQFIIGFFNDSPTTIEGWSEKGDQLRTFGQYEEAIEAYNKGLEIEPQSEYESMLAEVIISNKIWTFIDSGRIEDAIDALDQAIKKYPHNSMYWTQKGELLSILGRDAEAIEAFEQSLNIDCDDWAINGIRNSLGRHQKLNFHIVHNENDSCEVIYTETEDVTYQQEYPATQVQEENDDRSYQNSFQYLGQNIPISQQEYYPINEPIEQITTINLSDDYFNNDNYLPQNQKENKVSNIPKQKSRISKSKPPSFFGSIGAFVFNVFGTTAKTMGLQDLASGIFDMALKMDPNNDWALTSKGDIYYSQRKYEEAATAYDQAMEVIPENSPAFSKIQEKLDLIENNNPKKEETPLSKQSTSINPAKPETITSNSERKGVTYSEKNVNNYQKIFHSTDYSQDTYQNIIEVSDYELQKDPGNINALCQKGDALFHLGNYDEAHQSYSEALQDNPENLIAWYQKGSCLYHLGRYNEAIDVFDLTLRIYPDNADALCKKAEALYKLKRYDEAAMTYNQALKICPSSSDAKMGKERSLSMSRRM